MKRLLLSFILLFSFLTVAKSHENGLMFNAGSIFMGNFEVSFEKKLAKNFSISSGANYYNRQLAIWHIYSDGWQLGISLIPKLHVYGEAHKDSFYFAPSLRLGYLTHPARTNRGSDEKTDQGILWRFGGNFGYQHVFNCGLMLDILAGMEVYHNFLLSQKATRFQNEQKLLVRPYIAVSIGYAF